VTNQEIMCRISYGLSRLQHAGIREGLTVFLSRDAFFSLTADPNVSGWLGQTESGRLGLFGCPIQIAASDGMGFWVCVKVDD